MKKSLIGALLLVATLSPLHSQEKSIKLVVENRSWERIDIVNHWNNHRLGDCGALRRCVLDFKRDETPGSGAISLEIRPLTTRNTTLYSEEHIPSTGSGLRTYRFLVPRAFLHSNNTTIVLWVDNILHRSHISSVY